MAPVCGLERSPSGSSLSFFRGQKRVYRKKMQEYMGHGLCPSCRGSRLQPYPSATTLGGKKIHEITSLTLEEAKQFFDKLTLDEDEKIIAKDLILEIKKRLSFLIDVGLSYISLDRSSALFKRRRGAKSQDSSFALELALLEPPMFWMNPPSDFIPPITTN